MKVKPVKCGLQIYVKSDLYIDDLIIHKYNRLFYDYQNEPNISFFGNPKILKGFSFTVKQQSCESEVQEYFTSVTQLFYQLLKDQNEKNLIRDLSGVLR